MTAKMQTCGKVDELLVIDRTTDAASAGVDTRCASKLLSSSNCSCDSTCGGWLSCAGRCLWQRDRQYVRAASDPSTTIS